MDIYVVQPGDTLPAIAGRYGVTVESIVNANGLPGPNGIVPGLALLIPSPQPQPPPEPTRYTVQPGDTLYLIARRFGTTVEAIVAANALTNPNLIYPGQVLIIPAPAAPGPGGTVYVVQPGDTLWRIAQRFNTTVAAIVAANNLANPNLIYPGQRLIIPGAAQPPAPPPPGPKPAIESNGYFIPGTAAEARQKVTTLGPHLTYLSLFSYQVREDGSLSGLNAAASLEAARGQGVDPLAVVTNFRGETFDMELAHAILADPALRAMVVTNVRALLQSASYAGVNVDFENMRPEDRPLYNAFISEMAAAVRPDFLMSIAAAPKWADWPDLPWVGAFDYATLGGLVDFMIIMTYEWGWVGGPPMAIAPVNLVRRVLEYALSLIPRDKIMMGVPLYGYDWQLPDTPENLAATRTALEAQNLAISQGAAIQFDETAQSPWFRYTNATGVEHEVWFEDARSIQAKYLLLRELNLRGVSYWLVDYPFPQNWLLLQDMFSVRKLGSTPASPTQVKKKIRLGK